MREKLLIVYAVAILLGIATGIVGSLFQIAIHHLDDWIKQALVFINAQGGAVGLFSALISMLFLLIAWLMVRYIAPEAAGSGVQEIEGAVLHERPVFWRRLLPVKFIGGVLAISSKLVLGREGPTIQMGGNLGDMFGELFHLSADRRDTLIMAGAAAGLATAFNAPLAAVLFVMEELRNEFNFTFTNLKTVAIACIMATITLHYIIGSGPAIPMNVFALPSLKSLWLFFLFGIIVGFAGLLFNHSLMRTLFLTDKLTKWPRIFYLLLVGGIVGYLAYFQPDIVGGGYHIIERAVDLPPNLSVLILILVVRFLMTLICYSTGAPGGIFAPMLAIGSLLGSATFFILDYLIEDLSIHPGMFAVAGMGALFAAAIRAPITGIILVVEMTQNYLLILPLMVCCLTSTTIMQLAGNPPIYTQLLRRTLKRQQES
jgi:CIC family chloride channel protein